MMLMSATRTPGGILSPEAVKWPRRRDLFGVPVSATTVEDAAQAVIAAGELGVGAVVSCFSTHALVEASSDAELRPMAQSFEMITPDGQPVRWALNLLYRAGLKEPVTGRALTRVVCGLASKSGVSIYLYGSTPEVIEALQTNLVAQFPGLKIAGAESPPFRPLTAAEDDELVERINASGAGVVFVGLGCPKQDQFAFAHRDQIRAVQVCVGAVFDFYAGHKRVAPQWMQRYGLEWVYRLCQEPRRLWRRYLATNSVFLAKLALALVRPGRQRRRGGARHG